MYLSFHFLFLFCNIILDIKSYLHLLLNIHFALFLISNSLFYRTYNDIAEESNITASDFFSEAFNYEQNACRILPGTLLSMIREYYPRDDETGETSYPPPFSDVCIIIL